MSFHQTKLTRIAPELWDVGQILAHINHEKQRQALSSANVSGNSPRPGIETELAGIWTEILGISSVGANEDFFHLGGHSLLAVRMLLRVRDAFQVELPIDVLYSSDEFTIERLAHAIECERIGRLAGDDMSAAIAELESLSDEEIELRLRETES